MLDRTTRLFLRYRDRGEAAALAVVFDRTAPELLRLALHLCRNVADAEDLLQTTFVAAIESAGRFDRGQRVLPWLTGILVHRARAEHRRAQRAARELPREVPGTEGGDWPGVDPAHRTAERELSAHALAALERLKEPFRQPVVLRFVHGMEPAEIALVLRRSPGTVRGQIHRGLEQLRRILPAGLATTLLASTVATGRGLAAVRAAVLAEGARAAAAGAVPALAAVTATATGIAMTKKTLLAIAAIGLSLVVGALCWPRDGDPLAPDGTRATPATGAIAQTGPATPDGDRRPLPGPEHPGERVAPTMADDAASWRLEIEVLDGVDHAPIASATVAVHGPRSLTLLELQHAFADVAAPGWTGVPQSFDHSLRVAQRDLPPEVIAGEAAFPFLVPPAEGASPLGRATTDAEGRCALRTPAGGATLVVRHDGHGTAFEPVAEAPTGPIRIVLWPPRRVAGTVRMADTGEVPPERLRLRLCGDEGVWFADTDAQGRFAAAIAADQVEVQCATPGYATTCDYLKQPSGVRWHGMRTIPAGTDGDIYVVRFGATRLHVVDAATGAPIENVSLVAKDESGYPIRCGRFFAKDGWLELDHPRDVQGLIDQPEMSSYRAARATSLVVFAAGHAPHELTDVPLVGKAPPTIEVALEAGELAPFAGRVVRGTAAVAGARIQLRPLPPLQWDSRKEMVLATQRTAEGGEFALSAPPGEYVGEVFVDDALVCQQRVALPASGPHVIDLAATVEVDVLVVDAHGRPRQGHNVRVRADLGQRRLGSTDAAGHVVLGPLPAGPLRADAPREATNGSWVPAVDQEFTAAAGERPQVTLRLPPDERIRVVLAFDGPAPPAGFAGFTARETWGADTKPVDVAADGTVPHGLLPGSSQLAVDAPGGRTWRFAIPADARDGHLLTLRWSGLAYAGTVVDETGAAVPNVEVLAEPSQPGAQVTVRTDRDGRFRLDGLEPCPHLLSIDTKPARSQDRLFPRQIFRPFALPAAEPAPLRICFHRADGDLLRGLDEIALTGRLVDGDGAPVAGAIAGVSTLLPQADGVLEVWPRPVWQHTAADGTFRLQLARGPSYRTQFARKLGDALPREEIALPVQAGQTAVTRDFVLR